MEYEKALETGVREGKLGRGGEGTGGERRDWMGKRMSELVLPEIEPQPIGWRLRRCLP